MNSLSQVKGLNFKRYGLDYLFSLIYVKMKEKILRVAIRFLNLEFHIFIFGPSIEELCLIIKQF